MNFNQQQAQNGGLLGIPNEFTIQVGTSVYIAIALVGVVLLLNKMYK